MQTHFAQDQRIVESLEYAQDAFEQELKSEMTAIKSQLTEIMHPNGKPTQTQAEGTSSATTEDYTQFARPLWPKGV